MTLQEWIDRFLVEKAASNLIDPDTVRTHAIAAANFYAGYGALAAHLAIPIADPPPNPPAPYPDITAATAITVSEWAVIRPLFVLYVERETGIQLEASRGMGIDVFGRSTAEIHGDIIQMESEIVPHKAFCQPIISV